MKYRVKFDVKWKWRLKNQLRRSVGTFKSMCLILANNNTVLDSVWPITEVCTLHVQCAVWFYYPRNAVLAPILAMALCLSVCDSLSVRSRCSIETAGWIELVFGVRASFHLYYIVLKGNSGIFKNKGTCLSKFIQNFASRIDRRIETCYRLIAWQWWTLKVW